MDDKKTDKIEPAEGEVFDGNESNNHQLIIPDTVLPSVLTVLPLNQAPFFPTQVQT